MLFFFFLELIGSSNPSLPKGNTAIAWQCNAALPNSRHRDRLPFMLVTLFRTTGKQITPSATQEATMAITPSFALMEMQLSEFNTNLSFPVLESTLYYICTYCCISRFLTLRILLVQPQKKRTIPLHDAFGYALDPLCFVCSLRDSQNGLNPMG